MADNTSATSLPSIVALSPATARRIGSGQVLLDSSSAVKELIDNALDARAKSVFVEITANTTDTIQVKDDGHGIPAEDRTLLCRQYCTSKIRDFHDIKKFGGRWLGFRGEALSSMAEMSGIISVTTRVEGEPVAVKLRYGRDGELIDTERNSHPTGTTVRVTRFLEQIPVRKQTATKNSVKCLAKIRRLIQAYALARPAVRFRFHVLKAKSNRSDFIYTPRATSKVEDTVLQVIGKDCALECDWTAIESDGFTIHAFLPKPTAHGHNIAYQGAFISIDSRPVSNSRGTIKQMVSALKESLRMASPSLATVKDPFFCMNITCPPSSYDANIEPAKDDVMFDDGTIVLGVVDKLLRSYYSEAVVEVEHKEPPTPSLHTKQLEYEEKQITESTRTSAYEHSLRETDEDHTSAPRSDQPRWRTSMYGIDEDDLESLQENHPLVIEEEEGTRAADVSNPWTIARMNAPVKPKTTFTNGQLMSPVKSHGEWSMQASSPVFPKTPIRNFQTESLTPRSSPRIPVSTSSTSSIDHELEQNIQRLSQETFERRPDDTLDKHETGLPDQIQSGVLHAEAVDSLSYQNDLQNTPSETLELAVPTLRTLRHSKRKQASNFDKSLDILAQVQNATCFGNSMGNTRLRQPSRQQNSTLAAAERLTETCLRPNNSTDIRNFFGQNQRNQGNRVGEQLTGPSFTSINTMSRSSQLQRQLSSFAGRVERPFSRSRPSSQPLFSEATPFERLYESNDTPENHNLRTATQSRGTPSSLLCMLEPSLAGDERPSLMTGKANEVRTALGLSRYEPPSNNACNMTAYFKAHQDREGGSSDRRASPIRRPEPRMSPAHVIASKPCPPGVRITDRVQRINSLKPPLEWVPPGYHIQNFVLHLETTIASVMQSSRKLDMTSNSSEWKYSPEAAYDTLAEVISARKVMEWVIELDTILHQHCERLPDVDVQSLFCEGIQRGLDARKGEQVIDTGETVEAPLPTTNANVIEWIEGIACSSSQNEPQASTKTQDKMSELDRLQFVGSDADKLHGEDPAPFTTHRVKKAVDDEVEEDDMLMEM